MERDDDIEKISKELEDILKMTSDEKKDRTEDIREGKKPGDRQDTGVLADKGDEEIDRDSMPVIRLSVPVEGMEELYEYGGLEDDSDYDSEDKSVTAEEEYEEDEEENRAGEPFHEDRHPSFKKKEHKSGSLVKASDGLIAAFFVPVVIMIIIFAQRGIFPFGEESFLRTDMYHQYAPLMGMHYPPPASPWDWNREWNC